MKKSLIALLLTGAFILSCKPDRLKVNVRGIEVDMEILRLETDLFSMDPDSLPASMAQLTKKYGEFLSLFGLVIHIGETNNPVFPDYLKEFLTDRINSEVYRKTLEVYPDLNDLEMELSHAFRYYIYHFPNRNVPRIYTFISRFNASIVVDKDVLAIGLDRYLGTDCEYYGQLGLPQYLRQKMHRNKILSDCMYAWASTEWTFDMGKTADGPKENVLNRMIYEGKMVYFTRAMLPQESEELILGFTPGQLKFCEMNEQNMWVYLIEHKLLYDDNYITINKLTGEGPFTSYFPRESPARAAVWIGLKIVERYMEKMPEVTLEELMRETDYQKILSLSEYNP